MNKRESERGIVTREVGLKDDYLEEQYYSWKRKREQDRTGQDRARDDKTWQGWFRQDRKRQDMIEGLEDDCLYTYTLSKRRKTHTSKHACIRSDLMNTTILTRFCIPGLLQQSVYRTWKMRMVGWIRGMGGRGFT